MDLEGIYGGSFVNWEAVGASWAKRSVSSRLLLLGARRYLETAGATRNPERAALVDPLPVPDEVKQAFATVPKPDDPSAAAWGEFVDAALAAELEMISYGERPPLLHELRHGLEAAASEAGTDTPLQRWFLVRRAALPGGDLPEGGEYLPV
ncbi:MAG: hypothetical protein WA990_07780 [Rubrobacteraceae bacterium]